MKKIVTSVSAALLLALTPVMADDMGSYDMTGSGSEQIRYYGGGLALQSVSNMDSGIALVLNGGQTFPELQAGPGQVALEGEFTYSISAPSHSYSSYYGSYSVDFTIMTLAVYGTYIYDVTPEIYVKPRLGLLYESVSADGSGTYGSTSTSDTGLSFGVGAGYKIQDNLSVYADYTLIESDVSHLTVGVSVNY